MSFLTRAGLLGICVALLPGLAVAAVFTVNSTADLPDASPGDGVCDAGSGACTLRAAVQEANQTAASDTINVPTGVFILSRTGADEEASLVGDLDLVEPADIFGAGPGLTIVDGNASDRIFDIKAGIAVTISGMTLRNGAALTTLNYFGGAISVNQSTLDLVDCSVESSRANVGGGLRVSPSATASVLRTTFRGNQAVNLGITNVYGGAISNVGDLDLDECAVVSNTAVSGGGIFNENASTVSIRNSTISANTASAFAVGGIASQNTDTDLVNATLYGNSWVGLNFFTFDGSHSLSIKNSVLAANAGSDCVISPAAVLLDIEGEFNLDSDGTCPLNVSLGDFPSTDPQLGPLLLNGGMTPTHVPRRGSPVVDTGNNDTCEDVDQRGATRPLDGDGVGTVDVCDIGAVEVLPCTGDADLDLVTPPTPPVNTYEACFTITARTGFQVPSGGDITFRSRDSVALGNGFAVLAAASFQVIRDPDAGSGIVLPDAAPN